MDIINNYHKCREYGLSFENRETLKDIQDGKRPRCHYCGVFIPSPDKWIWNEDLHRREWHCISQDREIIRDGVPVGYRSGCITGVGEDPIVLHSGFEAFSELDENDIIRLRGMGYTDEMLERGLGNR